MGTTLRSMRSIGERRKTTGFVTSDPVVHALASDTEPGGDLGDLPAVLHDCHDRLITLLHDAELHQHLTHLLGPRTLRARRREMSKITRNCQRSAETGVQHQPKHLSKISRNC